MMKIVKRKIVAVYFQVKITRSGINTSSRVRKCVQFTCFRALRHLSVGSCDVNQCVDVPIFAKCKKLSLPSLWEA
jgi:hypothetical protein